MLLNFCQGVIPESLVYTLKREQRHKKIIVLFVAARDVAFTHYAVSSLC